MGANQPIKNGNWEEKRFETNLSNTFFLGPSKPGVRSMGPDFWMSVSPHLVFVLGVVSDHCNCYWCWRFNNYLIAPKH